jgi:hypothetical protein
MQQDNHRCLLSGCAFGRSKEDATREALNVWDDFEPKAQDTTLYFLEEFTHEMEQTWDCIDNLGKLPGFDDIPPEV